jgi:hypothetical protein
MAPMSEEANMGASRILSTHLGSLIRPREPLALIETRQEGSPVDQAALL